MAAVRQLNDAGIPTGVLIAPVLPGISDGEDQLRAVVEAAVEAGATHVSPILLHLRPGVREEFLPWLQANHPDLVPRYRATYRRGYAPEGERRRLTERVRGLLDRTGWRPSPAPAALRFTRPSERPATLDQLELWPR